MKTNLGTWAVTASRLREVLDYDASTGIFIWKMRIGRRGVSTVGHRAGTIDSNGYRYIRIDGKWYLAQKLAWFYVKGEWPEKALRFGNGDTDDCRIDNLAIRPVAQFAHHNKEGRNAYLRFDRKRDPDKYREYQLKRDFGIPVADYQALFVAQSGVCGCCKQPERDTRSGKTKWLAVDHNHETGAIRGLLCVACNTGIGKFGDDPERLRAAADYLERHAAAEPNNIIPLNARGRRNLTA